MKARYSILITIGLISTIFFTHSASATASGNAVRSIIDTGINLDIESSLFADSANPLMNELVLFETVLAGSEVHLRWNTVNEVGLEYFTVERSQDGRTFAQLGNRGDNITSNSESNFMAIDGSPFPGISYYRLRHDALGGQVIYSPVQAVKIESATVEIRLFPNPITEHLNLNLSGFHNQVVNIELKNMQGQLVYSETVQITGNTEKRIISMPSDFPNGVYLLTVTGEKELLSKRFYRLK